MPTDNPFYDGAGPHWDSVWAYGLRNPFRAFYDAPTGRLYIGDVGGNVNATSNEELELGARGANYGWPDSEGQCSAPCTSPLYDYEHNGTNAAITGGFVYHGTQFPSSMQGNYFFADYAQHWIKRLIHRVVEKILDARVRSTTANGQRVLRNQREDSSASVSPSAFPRHR